MNGFLQSGLFCNCQKCEKAIRGRKTFSWVALINFTSFCKCVQNCRIYNVQIGKSSFENFRIELIKSLLFEHYNWLFISNIFIIKNCKIRRCLCIIPFLRRNSFCLVRLTIFFNNLKSTSHYIEYSDVDITKWKRFKIVGKKSHLQLNLRSLQQSAWYDTSQIDFLINFWIARSGKHLGFIFPPVKANHSRINHICKSTFWKWKTSSIKKNSSTKKKLLFVKTEFIFFEHFSFIKKEWIKKTKNMCLKKHYYVFGHFTFIKKNKVKKKQEIFRCKSLNEIVSWICRKQLH